MDDTVGPEMLMGRWDTLYYASRSRQYDHIVVQNDAHSPASITATRHIVSFLSRFSELVQFADSMVGFMRVVATRSREFALTGVQRPGVRTFCSILLHQINICTA
jgi:hypothetical protein